MYKREHKKLQELQVIQASNFLLLSKLFSNLTINNNFRFHLPMSSEKERKLSKINFNLKKISKYTSNLEIVMESPLTKKDIKDAEFIFTQDFDWIALSFVRNSQDIIDLKKLKLLDYFFTTS